MAEVRLVRFAQVARGVAETVLAVETERNAQRCGIAWQFTSRDARHKLERLYPLKASLLD
jgi:hypothetical protein